MSIKIIKIYKNLKKKEIKRFALFLKSKYHVSNTLHIEIFHHFKNWEESKTSSNIEVFCRKNKLSNINYKKLCSEHFNLIKTFVHLEFNQHKNKENLSIISHLKIEDTLLRSEIKKARKELEKSKINNFYSNILDDYNLSKVEMNMYLNEKKIPLEKLKTKFIAQNDALDSFYLWQKLKQICSYYNLKSVLQFDDELLLQEEVEYLMSKSNSKFNLIISLYWEIIQIRKNTDNIHLFEAIIEKIKTKEFEKIHFSDQKEIFQYVIGLCIIMIVRKNQIQFNITLFNLYKEALNKNYLTDNQNFISQRTFKNIVRSALNNNQQKWTKALLKNGNYYIRPEDVEFSLAYNYGVYFFYTKEYKKALKSFSLLPYDNLFYAIDLRTYMVRLYFTLEEIDALFSLIDSFRAFLKRNNTHSTVMISSLRNFLNAVKKIVQTNPRDLKKLKALKVRITNLNPVVEKKWLLSVLENRISNLDFLSNL